MIDGKKPTLREQLDATREPLDRSVGNPIQTIVEKGDDTSKEVLATMQALLKLNTEAPAEVEAGEMPVNVSPIDQMRTKSRK